MFTGQDGHSRSLPRSARSARWRLWVQGRLRSDAFDHQFRPRTVAVTIPGQHITKRTERKRNRGLCDVSRDQTSLTIVDSGVGDQFRDRDAPASWEHDVVSGDPAFHVAQMYCFPRAIFSTGQPVDDPGDYLEYSVWSVVLSAHPGRSVVLSAHPGL